MGSQTNDKTQPIGAKSPVGVPRPDKSEASGPGLRADPRSTLRPLNTIGAQSARRTFAFPTPYALDVPQTSTQTTEQESSSSDRVPTVKPPPALDLALEDNGVPEGVRSQQELRAIAAPVVRWTTPNRRPPSPRAVERAARSSERYLQDTAEGTQLSPATTVSATAPTSPPPPPPRALAAVAATAGTEEISSRHLVEASSDLPSDLPSDRQTIPTGVLFAPPPPGGIVELSPAELESGQHIPGPPPLPRRARITLPVPAAQMLPWQKASGRPGDAIDTPLVMPSPISRTLSGIQELSPAFTAPAQAASLGPRCSSAPPVSIPARDVETRIEGLRYRRALIPIVASHVVLAAIALFVGLRKAPITGTREARVAIRDRSPLASVVGVSLPDPPSGGCTTSGASRMLAQRAQIGPGLDLAVLETGFGVGIVSGTTEATGIRIEGSGLRVAETVRVKASTAVSHVTVDQGHDEELDGLDVRVDSDEARTVMGGEGPSFKVAARGGRILAFPDEPHGNRAHTLWPLPGAPTAGSVGAPPGASPYLPGGLWRVAPKPTPAIVPPALGPSTIRVARRDDGGAVVALRRPAVLWLGVVDASLAPAGPLVPVVRKGATVGAPSVAQWGGGGVVAWAERTAADKDWTIVVAGFTPDGEGATSLGVVREVARGMSPTIAALPDGDLLLAYSEGPSGAHRVLALRLTSALEARGEPLVVSPDTVNAGQPVAAVRADGRALVAFFAAARGRLGSVHATPLACDPGL